MRELKKLLFLFNPIAGKAQIKDRLLSIITYYTEQEYLVTAYPTNTLLNELLSQSMDYYNLIICAGGDGTLSRVVSSYMLTGCKTPLGYLPMGSTNDFARTLGYTSDFNELLKQSCRNSERRIDVGKFNDSYFVYVAAFGTLTEISYCTSQLAKNVLGYFAYILKGIQKIADLKSYVLRLESAEKSFEGEFCMGFVMNSLSIGGFKNPVSRFVELDDGVFEVLLIRMPKNLNELQHIIADLLGQRITSEMLVYLQTDCLKIYSADMEWTLDGEFGGSVNEAEIKNCQQALCILGT